jgi:hypothetical protein
MKVMTGEMLLRQNDPPPYHNTMTTTSNPTTVSQAIFYLGKHWSDDTYQQLIFFSSNSDPAKTSLISISPNSNKSFDVKSLINDPNEVVTVANHTLPAIPPSAVLSPTPPPAVQRLGVVDENGVMQDEFVVGEYDPDAVENRSNETKVVDSGEGVTFRVPTLRLVRRESGDRQISWRWSERCESD